MSIAITGAGCISPLGNTLEETWQALRTGKGGIAPIRLSSRIALTTSVAAQVHDFETNNSQDRATGFALQAAAEALQQAAFPLDDLNRYRCAVIVGSANGAENTREQAYAHYHSKDRPVFHPLTVPKLMFSAPAAQISMHFGLKGPSFMVSSACASANHALIQAAMVLDSSQADMVVAGGTEASLTPGFIRAWEVLRIIAPDTCRPFCRTRKGVVMGEGAGMFVLERSADARARGATILAELAGFGMTSDAGHLTRPDRQGVLRAMQMALTRAGIAPEELDYINAHGTGTALNDVTEAEAINLLLKKQVDNVAVSSTKSSHGHLLGAAGAIELVAVLGAMRDGVIAPTLNMQEQDPACEINVVSKPVNRQVNTALSNSFAFGGMNAVIALSAAKS